MQLICEIISNGENIFDRLADRLMSVEVHDEAEDKSDRVSIKLDDRARFLDGALVEIPLVGTTIEVLLGYKDGVKAHMGTYLIDDISVESPPRTLTVTGRAAKMPKSYRTPRTQSYHQKTIAAIMKEVAERSGYEPKVDPALARIVVRHIDQHNESDMAFATRLAGLHDGVARPVDGKLAVAKKGTGKSVTGAELPVVTLTESMCSQWRFQYSARDEAGEAAGMGGSGGTDQKVAGDSRLPPSDQLDGGDTINLPSDTPAVGEKGGVRAHWHDIRTSERKAVTIGKAPYHDLRYTHHNEAEAKAAVSAYKNKSSRGKAGFSCQVGGEPTIRAEAKLVLASFRAYIPELWRIKSCTHRFEPGGGYTTNITAELFDEKQEDAAGNVSKTKPSKDDKIDPNAPPEPTGGDPINLPK
ncbi:phage late control D family protein [Rhodomicrobium lacus]|uniref:phage late control D family protein n=1 Tax=Rhodomicrobium lacus TaxID=2498452 RepID=UPI000F8C9798|nr:contractile injection system protein, VgrG/Pvc8 family [Rhodomicrobium lacus]